MFAEFLYTTHFCSEIMTSRILFKNKALQEVEEEALTPCPFISLCPEICDSVQ